MGFTLWDTRSGNALAYSADEAEVLAVVRELLADEGPAIAADLLLLYQDARGANSAVVPVALPAHPAP